MNYPLKIPRDFIPKTLSSLLPPPTIIERLGREELLRLMGMKQELSHLIEIDPVRFYRPNEGGQRGFMECQDPRARILAMFAGNKSGKTTAGAIRTLERLYGSALWGREYREVSYPTPARGVVFAEDFDSHREITIPALYSWSPRGFIERSSRNPAGHVTELRFSNGSILNFRTYDQGPAKAEGKDWDIVWCDEPPPRDIFTAVFRGVVSNDGIILITATLLKETWLYDELEHTHVLGFEAGIHDNVWISEEAKDDFLRSLTEEERSVREFGKPASLTGVVYKNFKDSEPFVIPPVEIPKGAPIIAGVDPHERRPIYIEWAWITPDDRIIWFDWDLIQGDVNEIFSKIREHEDSHPARTVLVVMDPNRGRTPQIGQVCWMDVFEEQGFPVLLGDDNIRIGHTAMRTFLDPKRPRMQWTEQCRGKSGPIYQMLRYSWDDWSHGKMEKELKEKPKDRHKDFPDIHRYIAVAGLSYDALRYGPEIRDYAPASWRFRELRAYA